MLISIDISYCFALVFLMVNLQMNGQTRQRGELIFGRFGQFDFQNGLILTIRLKIKIARLVNSMPKINMSLTI